MPRIKYVAGYVVATLVLAASAQADMIYEQSPLSCEQWVMGFYPSDFSLEYAPDSIQVLDDFTLAASVNLVDIHWWGVGGSEEVDDFTVRLFTGSWDSPSVLAELRPETVSRASTSYIMPLPGNLALDVWAYGFNLAAPIALEGGVPYYISIVNNTPGGLDWAWTFGSGPNHVAAVRTGNDNEWSEVPFVDMGYQLTGTVVPEPATLTLLALGMAGFMLRAARRVVHR